VTQIHTAKKLGPDEADRTDQIAFILYDSLWTKNGTWSDITETTEECIPSLNPDDDNDELCDNVNDSNAPSPDCTMREPQTSTKVCFVNLTHMLNWNKGIAEGLFEPTFLQPKFLVREEYHELYKYLDDNSKVSQHFLLLGQPGIGLWILCCMAMTKCFHW
jgi:hypothetical protein